jgi:prepilin-type N-terminal cleavage/methylation domain-containing protein
MIRGDYGSEPSRPHAGDGFTIVELLVVLTIIAVILVITIPAVQSAREAAMRNQCAQRQSRLALAMVTHNLRKEFLPAAQSIFPLDSTINPGYTGRTIGWPIHLLPFLEHTDVYMSLMADKGWNDQRNSSAGATTEDSKLTDFACPTKGFFADDVCPINYHANCGTGASTGVGRNDGVLIGTEYSIAPSDPAPPSRSLEEVTNGDGLAATILFSENYEKKGEGGSAEFEWNRDLSYTRASVSSNIVSQRSSFGRPLAFSFSGSNPFIGLKSATPPVNGVINGGGLGDGRPRSLHPTGAVAVFCDGHSRFLHDSLSTYVYAQILTSRSVWNGSTTYVTNSTTANTWLKSASAPQPYRYDPKDLDP